MLCSARLLCFLSAGLLSRVVIICLHDLGSQFHVESRARESCSSLCQTITCHIECHSFFAGKEMLTPALREHCRTDLSSCQRFTFVSQKEDQNSMLVAVDRMYFPTRVST
jgi:hypothetical protein